MSLSNRLHICMLSRAVMQHHIGGGMEMHAEALRQGLVERGHRVTMITTPHPRGLPHERDAWGETLFVGTGAPAEYTRDWWRASLAAMLQLHAHDPIDVVAGHGKTAYAYLGVRRRLATIEQAPTVVITHNTIIDDLHGQIAHLRDHPKTVVRWLPRGAAYYLDDRRRLPLAEEITATTEENASALRRLFSLDPSRIAVIPNGVDVATLMAGAALREAFRQRLGVTDDEVRIVLVLARLVQDKGQHYLLDALAAPELQAYRRKLRIVLAGDGPTRSDLVAQAETLGLQDAVLFLGRVPHDEVTGLLAAADIVALPTVREGMSLSLLEAMACGRPVVTSDIPTLASFVEDGVTGSLVPVAQPTALAQAIARLVADPTYAHELGARGQAYVAARYDQRVMVEGYERVFLRAASAARTPLRLSGDVSSGAP